MGSWYAAVQQKAGLSAGLIATTTSHYQGSQTDPPYGHYRKLGVPETEVAVYPKMNTGLVALATRARAKL